MGAEKGNEELLCPDYQSEQSILVVLVVEGVQNWQYQSLQYVRDNNGIDKTANIIRNLGRGRHHSQLPKPLGNQN